MRKTTVELPDELMREIRLRTALENRKLKDVMADLLRRGLESVSDAGPGRGGRIQFPLIVGTRAARPGQEITPEAASRILLDEEASRETGAA